MLQILFVVWVVAAWFTHLYACFTEQAWGFLIGGAISFLSPGFTEQASGLGYGK